MSQPAEEIRLEDDTFKILVSTDNHLGYAEKDPIRENDTFVTFEEILKTAVEQNVDFILLAGDLFHEARPSPYCYQKCAELLRKYCFGDKPVAIEILSDPAYNFRSLKDPVVNYEDFNLNVAIPVFTIHGNHDDPVGQKQTSALDVLASAGLVNYFGRWTEMAHVEISPILFQKGRTKLALYGLSHIKDERLGRLFRNKKVSIIKPPTNDWFNVLVLHQNRAERGMKNFIPESVIPDFFDLVIWGHEHDCRIEPEAYPNFYVSQPGSTVATSLSKSESIPKKMGMLYIHGQDFHMDFIALKTVRPFIYSEILLPRVDDDNFNFDNPLEQAESIVKIKVLEMIREVPKNYPDNEMLPLIRLKVHYFVENQQLNTIRFGQKFLGKVANHQDIVLLKYTKLKPDGTIMEVDFDDELFENVDELAQRVEDYVGKYLDKTNTHLDILSVKGITSSVIDYIDKDDVDAIGDMIDAEAKLVYEKMLELDPAVDQIDDCIERIRELRSTDPNMQVVLPERRARRSNTDNHDNIIDVSDSDNDEMLFSTKSSKRSSRGGTSSRGKRGSRTSKSKTSNSNNDQSDSDDFNIQLTNELRASVAEPPKRGKGSRGGRGSRSRGKAK